MSTIIDAVYLFIYLYLSCLSIGLSRSCLYEINEVICC